MNEKGKPTELMTLNVTKVDRERHLFLTDLFKKDYIKIKDSQLKTKVINTMEELDKALKDSVSEVNLFLQKRKSKKFKGKSNLYKFYMTSSNRVIYAFGKDIGKLQYSDSIFLLRYVQDHDKQGLVAKNTNNYDGDQVYLHSFKNLNNSEEVSLEKSIVYYVVRNKIKNLLNDNNDFSEVLLNYEQDKCLIGSGPLIIKGNAGSGKTLVSLNLMKMLDENLKRGIYLTYSDSLKNLVEKEFTEWGYNSKNRFFSISKYFMKILNVDIRQYVDYFVFKRWYTKEFTAESIDSYDLWCEIHSTIKGYMFSNWDRDLKEELLMKYEEYMSLNKIYSKFNEKEKKRVLFIAQEYNKWLSFKNYYDDNDLARNIILKIKHGEINKIQCAVIDEVQDLTDVQIQGILTIVENLDIYFCGDQNQIVNPTLFNFKRLSQAIFLKQILGKNTITLKRNYRSVPSIVNYINYINKIRQQYIGKQKLEDDMDEIAIRKEVKSCRIKVFKCNNKNLTTIVSIFEETPSAAVIVSNLKVKEYVEKLFNKKINCLFTVKEVKGLEFKHILCYKLIDENIEAWIEIFNNNGRRSTSHRYYFNLFYVAITRARENLFLMEENILHNLLDKSLMKFNGNKVINKNILNLDCDIEAEEWLYQGEKFEVRGVYDRALMCYEKYGVITGEDVTGEVKRCKAFINKINGRYDIAGEYFLMLGNYEEAYECFSRVNNIEKIIECQLKSKKTNVDKDKLVNYMTNTPLTDNLIHLLEKYYFRPTVKEYKEECDFLFKEVISDLEEIKYE